jgi:hypothetical protein
LSGNMGCLSRSAGSPHINRLPIGSFRFRINTSKELGA